jgi:ABC-type oligopeptide transport system substrate-binding subunit
MTLRTTQKTPGRLGNDPTCTAAAVCPLHLFRGTRPTAAKLILTILCWIGVGRPSYGEVESRQEAVRVYEAVQQFAPELLQTPLEQGEAFDLALFEGEREPQRVPAQTPGLALNVAFDVREPFYQARTSPQRRKGAERRLKWVITFPELLVARAVRLWQEGREEQAIRTAERARQLAPRWAVAQEFYAHVLLERAKRLMEQGGEDRASGEQLAQAVLAEHPSLAKLAAPLLSASYGRRARESYDQGELEAARHWCAQALRLDARQLEALAVSRQLNQRFVSLLQKAEGLLQEGEVRQVFRLLDAARRLDPEDPKLRSLERRALQQARILYAAVPYLPAEVDPARPNGTVERLLTYLLYERLEESSSAASSLGEGYAPAIWERADDGHCHVLKLRKDTRWWNGEPVTAWEIASALARRIPGWAADLLPFPISPYQIRVEHPFQLMVRWQKALHGSAIFSGLPLVHDREYVPGFPMGTGSYRPVAAPDGRWMKLERNPHFREAPTGSFVEFRLQAFQTGMEDIGPQMARGEYGLVFGVDPVAAVRVARASRRIRYLSGEPLELHLVVLNPRHGILREPELRQALWHGVNAAQVRQHVWPASAAPQVRSAALDPRWPLEDRRIEWLGPLVPNQALAAAYVQRYRQMHGNVVPPLTLIYADRGPLITEACAELQRQWAHIGLTVQLAPRPERSFRSALEGQCEYELVYWITSAPFGPTAIAELLSLWNGGASLTERSRGRLEYELWRLAQARTLGSRMAVLSDLQRFLLQEALVIPVAQVETAVLCHEDLGMSPLAPFTGFMDSPERLFSNLGHLEWQPSAGP